MTKRGDTKLLQVLVRQARKNRLVYVILAEDRLEHLCASVSATDRMTTLEAAVDRDGRITALSFDQLEDCGAHLRAPEPATLYRMGRP